jgi:hypothetical protein
MGAALEVVHTEAAALEQAGGPAGVLRSAAVGGADQSEVGVVEAEALDSSGEDQRQGLKRLGGGPQVDRGARIAEPGDELSVRSDDGGGAEVPGLRPAAADDGGDPLEQTRWSPTTN